MSLFQLCLLTIIEKDIDYSKLPHVIRYYLREIDDNIRNYTRKCYFGDDWWAVQSYDFNKRRQVCVPRMNELLYKLLKDNLTKLNDFSTYKIVYGIRDVEYHMTLFMNYKKIERVYCEIKCSNFFKFDYDYEGVKNITDIIANMLQIP